MSKEQEPIITAPLDNKGRIDWKTLQDGKMLTVYLEQEARLFRDLEGGLSTMLLKKRPDILTGISYYPGRLTRLKAVIGIDQSRKPKGYWNNEENIKSELENLMGESKNFPSQDELRKLKMYALSRAISRTGGSKRWKKILNIGIIQQQSWSSEKTKDTLEEVIHQLGHFPSKNELDRLGLSSLRGAMERYGGSNYWRVNFGFGKKRGGKGEKKFWTEEMVTSQLKYVIQELGHFPSKNEMLNMRRVDLIYALKIFGGINYWRKRFGKSLLNRETGYWNNENIQRELKIEIGELGHFPSQKDLKQRGKSSLARAMWLAGGIRLWRKQFGVPDYNKEVGYWKNEENIYTELQIIINQIGHFPSRTELQQLRKGYLISVLKERGINFWRTKFGEKILRKDKQYVSNKNIGISDFLEVEDE